MARVTPNVAATCSMDWLAASAARAAASWWGLSLRGSAGLFVVGGRGVAGVGGALVQEDPLQVGEQCQQRDGEFGQW